MINRLEVLARVLCVCLAISVGASTSTQAAMVDGCLALWTNWEDVEMFEQVFPENASCMTCQDCVDACYAKDKEAAGDCCDFIPVLSNFDNTYTHQVRHNYMRYGTYDDSIFTVYACDDCIDQKFQVRSGTRAYDYFKPYFFQDGEECGQFCASTCAMYAMIACSEAWFGDKTYDANTGITQYQRTGEGEICCNCP